MMDCKTIELENSLEPVIPRKTPNVTKSSVFDFAFVLSPEKDNSSEGEYTEYELKLQNEVMQWHKLMTDTKNETKNCNIHKVASFDVLEKESREYLCCAPDLQDFVQGSIDFQIKAQKYLCQHNDILDTHERLLDVCQNRLGDYAQTIAMKYLKN